MSTKVEGQVSAQIDTKQLLGDVLFKWRKRSQMLKTSLEGVHPSTAFWAKITSQKKALDICIAELEETVGHIT